MTLRSEEEGVDGKITITINGTELSLSSPEKAIRQLAYDIEKEFGVPREAQVKLIQADIEVREAKQ